MLAALPPPEAVPRRSAPTVLAGATAGTPIARHQEGRQGAAAAIAALTAVSAVVAAWRPRRLGRRRAPRVRLGPFRRDLSLDGYPVHGPGYYWTLSQCTGAVLIYMPIADDVTSKDVIFDCKDWNLKLGVVPEKGDLVINDKVLYKVDTEESYFLLDTGEYGERCVVVWLYKLAKEQDWYAYDRFEPVSERFLLEGEKKRADLAYKITHKAYLDVEVEADKGGVTKMGRIVIGLWGELAPKTVENFRALCTGEKGKSEETGEPLHYKGTTFHRVIRGFCVQGGQTFENEDGSGGESIYGGCFEDENLRVKFKKPGMLAMANGGPDTNGSQFFITTCKAEHLSHHCVGFGEVLEGMDVVRALEALGTEEDDAPTKIAVISDCGEIKVAKVEESGGFYKVPSARETDENTELREDMMRRVLVGGGSATTA